jgi:hypothetical protein
MGITEFFEVTELSEVSVTKFPKFPFFKKSEHCWISELIPKVLISNQHLSNKYVYETVHLSPSNIRFSVRVIKEFNLHVEILRIVINNVR